MIPKYKVAIVCITYNHQEYISDALDSFLNQITDFEFQVIIHDDASTDNTSEIIKEYKEKYPNKIFPIIQLENQFSKGIAGNKYRFKQINNLIDSEYVAICEGDDYWIDNYKLQKQVYFLDNNRTYSASTHRVRVFDDIEQRFIRKEGWNKERIKTEEFILYGAGIVPTSSIVVRSKYFKLPPFGAKYQFGDYQFQIYVSLNGQVFNFLDYMGVYRLNSINSFTTNLKKGHISNTIEIYNQIITMLEELKEFVDAGLRSTIELKVIQLKLHQFIMNERPINEPKWSLFLIYEVIILATLDCNKIKQGLFRRACRIITLAKLFFTI